MTTETITQPAEGAITPTPHILVLIGANKSKAMEVILSGATTRLKEMQIPHEIRTAPGLFELPQVLRMCIRSYDFLSFESEGQFSRFDGYVVLGVSGAGLNRLAPVHIQQEVLRKLNDIACESTLAMGLGIHDEGGMTPSDSIPRIGAQAADTCLAMLDIKKDFKLWPRPA